MNRRDFLLKIQELFDDLNTGLINAYKAVLNDPNGSEINYDELYKLLLKEYKYANAPRPYWFAEKLQRVKNYRIKEFLIDRHVREGKAKILKEEPERMRRLIQMPNGKVDYFYYGIVTDEVDE